MASATNIISGIAFPYRLQNQGIPAAAQGVDVIRYAIIVLIRTKMRSRLMRPNTGMNLHQLLFEDQGPSLQSLITREILTQLATQLPQVSVQSISFDPPTDKNYTVGVNVRYIVQGIMDQTGTVNI